MRRSGAVVRARSCREACIQSLDPNPGPGPGPGVGPDSDPNPNPGPRPCPDLTTSMRPPFCGDRGRCPCRLVATHLFRDSGKKGFHCRAQIRARFVSKCTRNQHFLSTADMCAAISTARGFSKMPTYHHSPTRPLKLLSCPKAALFTMTRCIIAGKK